MLLSGLLHINADYKWLYLLHQKIAYVDIAMETSNDTTNMTKVY